MQYLGIDWAYRRAAWCARNEGGAITGEGMVPADEDGLAKLVLAVGTDAKACAEMMSGRGLGPGSSRRRRLRSSDRRCAQGSGGRAAGVQDRQGRRACAVGAVPA
jgi:hypothetical protein